MVSHGTPEHRLPDMSLSLRPETLAAFRARLAAGAAGVALGWRAADPVFGLLITVAILVVVKNAARNIYWVRLF